MTKTTKDTAAEIIKVERTPSLARIRTLTSHRQE